MLRNRFRKDDRVLTIYTFTSFLERWKQAVCRLMQTFAFEVPKGQPRPSGAAVGDSLLMSPPSYLLRLQARD